MKKIVVLHLLPSSNFSGAESVVCQIIQMFSNENNFQMYYICTGGSIQKYLDDRNINYYLLPAFSRKNVKKAIKKIKPDIIHAHDFTASVMAANFAKIPIISHIHNNPPWLGKINFKTIGFAIASFEFSKIYGVSESVRSEYIFKNILNKKFEVLSNVVNTGVVFEQANRLLIEENIDILFVGRLTYQKNPLGFLKIVNKVKDKYKKIQVVMLGKGDMEKECREYIKKHNLEKNVHMKGFVDNPYPYMKKAKLLLMPSFFEGFGLVAVEAMSLGTPVFCSGVGGLINIVDNTCGAICQNDEEYVEHILDYLGNEELCKKMKENAILKAKRFSNLTTYKNCLKEQYINLCK